MSSSRPRRTGARVPPSSVALTPAFVSTPAQGTPPTTDDDDAGSDTGHVSSAPAVPAPPSGPPAPPTTTPPPFDPSSVDPAILAFMQQQFAVALQGQTALATAAGQLGSAHSTSVPPQHVPAPQPSVQAGLPPLSQQQLFAPPLSSAPQLPTQPSFASHSPSLPLQPTNALVAFASSRSPARLTPGGVPTVLNPPAHHTAPAAALPHGGIVAPDQSALVPVPCERSTCPCDAFDNRVGNFCCRTCHAGTACLSPFHKTVVYADDVVHVSPSPLQAPPVSFMQYQPQPGFMPQQLQPQPGYVPQTPSWNSVFAQPPHQLGPTAICPVLANYDPHTDCCLPLSRQSVGAAYSPFPLDERANLHQMAEVSGLASYAFADEPTQHQTNHYFPPGAPRAATGRFSVTESMDLMVGKLYQAAFSDGKRNARPLFERDFNNYQAFKVIHDKVTLFVLSLWYTRDSLLEVLQMVSVSTPAAVPPLSRQISYVSILMDHLLGVQEMCGRELDTIRIRVGSTGSPEARVAAASSYHSEHCAPTAIPLSKGGREWLAARTILERKAVMQETAKRAATRTSQRRADGNRNTNNNSNSNSNNRNNNNTRGKANKRTGAATDGAAATPAARGGGGT